MTGALGVRTEMQANQSQKAYAEFGYLRSGLAM